MLKPSCGAIERSRVVPTVRHDPQLCLRDLAARGRGTRLGVVYPPSGEY